MRIIALLVFLLIGCTTTTALGTPTPPRGNTLYVVNNSQDRVSIYTDGYRKLGNVEVGRAECLIFTFDITGPLYLVPFASTQSLVTDRIDTITHPNWVWLLETNLRFSMLSLQPGLRCVK